MAHGNRGKGVSISKKSLSRNNPSMATPGNGEVVIPASRGNAFGGERSASAYADAQSNIGGSAKHQKRG